MEYLGIGLTFFGAIFLVITIINFLTMYKKVQNPNCPEDVHSVAYNKKWGKIYLAVYSAMLLAGIIILLVI